MVNYKTINSGHCTTATIVIFIMWEGIPSRMEPKNAVGKGTILKTIILEKDIMNKGKKISKTQLFATNFNSSKAKIRRVEFSLGNISSIESFRYLPAFLLLFTKTLCLIH